MNGELKFEDRGGGRFDLVGTLGFETVTAALQASERLFDGHDRIELCLARVTRSDSAAVALLIEWQARARTMGRTIAFRSAPQQLIAIARLTDVEELLPLA